LLLFGENTEAVAGLMSREIRTGGAHVKGSHAGQL